ncbi:MAG: PspA/IM30 family protein, partial [Acidobacteriota bacterium]
AELAERQADRLADQLADQEHDTAQIRESIARMQEQLGHSRSRLQVLHAQLRQGEARRAMGKIMRGAERSNLYGEFERLGERVELRVAEENAYLRLGDELSGDDLRRRCEKAEVDDAVDDRMERLRAEVAASRAEGEAQ